MKSMTLEEIQEIEGRNRPNTLYKHIRILQKKKLVESGAKVERANGYFINEAGLELLKKYVSDSKQGVSLSTIHSVKLLPKEIKGGVSWMKKKQCFGSNAYKSVCPVGFL